VQPTLRRADAVVVPSGFLELVFAGRGIAASVVPNIIDLTRFSGHGAVDRVTGHAAPHIIVTRNLEPIYDIGTALRAFAIFRQRFAQARLTVAGSGPERENLEALAATLGLGDEVTFTGEFDNAGIAELYRTASTMLNPSLVDNMPISILESLASGVPVVSTNVGGVPHLVQDGQTALLVPPGSPGAMAEAMSRIATDEVLARHLSEAGSAAVQIYAWPNVRDRLVDVYARVTAGTQRAVTAAAK
jgi:glycosyltransferase involved in cell wall biosynthesis